MFLFPLGAFSTPKGQFWVVENLNSHFGAISDTELRYRGHRCLSPHLSHGSASFSLWAFAIRVPIQHGQTNFLSTIRCCSCGCGLDFESYCYDDGFCSLWGMPWQIFLCRNVPVCMNAPAVAICFCLYFYRYFEHSATKKSLVDRDPPQQI